MHLIMFKLHENEFIKLEFLIIMTKKKHYLYLNYWKNNHIKLSKEI